MRSKTRKILAFTICFVLIFCSLPMTAFGAAKTVKQTINLNSTKDLKGAGYNWDASKHTLTLENADLKASGKPIFKLDKKANVKIVLKGENKLSCPDAAVISSGGSKNGGRLTFTGTGSLEVEGYMYINSKEVTVANCKLQVSPAKGVPGIYRSFTNTGSGDFIVTGGAKVTLKDGLNAGAKNDKLIVNGAELNVSSAYFGSTVDVSSDVIVKNGGKLKVSNLYKPAEEEESEGITRFSNGIFTAGNVIFDESSIVDISSLYGIGIKIDGGNCTILSQELLIKGGQQAIRVLKFKEDPVIEMPENAAWNYFVSSAKDEDASVYTATLSQKKGDKVFYNFVEDLMTGGAKEIYYVSPEVTKAIDTLSKVSLSVTAKAYEASEEKESRIRIWWSQPESQSQDITGYQVARATEEDGNYEVMYTTIKDEYYNTSNLIKNTSYYYKVRPYIQVNDTLYFGAWSDAVTEIAK